MHDVIDVYRIQSFVQCDGTIIMEASIGRKSIILQVIPSFTNYAISLHCGW